MTSPQKNSLIKTYLEVMQTFPPVTIESVEKVTLKRLRLEARSLEDEMTQKEVAEAIGVDASTVSRWERGLGLKGIPYYQIQQMSLLFGRDLLEIHAAITNTEKIFEGKSVNLQHEESAPPPEVVQR